MDSAKAMIVWTPNRAPSLESATKGKIAVTTVPEPAEFRAYWKSVGACNQNWLETDSYGRQELMQRYITQMIHRDGLDEDDVLEAISVIDDFRDVTFSTEPPVEEEEVWY